MRIGLISDTHIPEAGKEIWPEIRDAFSDVDIILHGGDITVARVLDELETIAPVLAAQGNHDDHLYEDPRVELIHHLEFEGHSLALLHRFGPIESEIDELIHIWLNDVRPEIIVCGDSHTATHGAFGALAFGIGTSEVEHVLATQTLIQKPAKNMRITVDGILADSVTAKDVILAIIGKIGTAGGTGHVIEFAGSVIRGFSMEGRMTVCNMAIEAGARAGMIAPDQTTYDYLADRPMTPKGDHWDCAVAYWQTLPSDDGAVYDVEITLAAEDIAPTVTWGTSPEDALAITDAVPNPDKEKDANKRAKMERAIAYMGLKPGQKLTDIKVDTVFIGSCTNSRIEDLRAAAALAEGRKVADGMRALVVPGSGLVKEQAEAEGLDKVFIDAGFEWREPGCSMCLAMNADKLTDGERCASTSNRNFEGRQGRGGRTHLVSPQMAVAAALSGHLTDVRNI